MELSYSWASEGRLAAVVVEQRPSSREAVFHVGAPLKAGPLPVDIEKVLNSSPLLPNLLLEG